MTELDPAYYEHQRVSLAHHIATGAHWVLDVGCGAGHFGAFLKADGRAVEVYGIELSPEAARRAARKLAYVECADLDTLNFQRLHAKWQNQQFDYIVFADVLEHVKDPWRILREFVSWLRPGGYVVTSIPNVRHWSVLLPLVFRGQWQYLDAGIMDRTHLRFFTRASALDLVQKCNLNISSVSPLIGGHWRDLSKLTLHAFDEFLAIQYVIKASH